LKKTISAIQHLDEAKIVTFGNTTFHIGPDPNSDYVLEDFSSLSFFKSLKKIFEKGYNAIYANNECIITHCEEGNEYYMTLDFYERYKDEMITASTKYTFSRNFSSDEMAVPKSDILKDLKYTLKDTKKYYEEESQEEIQQVVQQLEKLITAIQNLNDTKIVQFGEILPYQSPDPNNSDLVLGYDTSLPFIESLKVIADNQYYALKASPECVVTRYEAGTSYYMTRDFYNKHKDELIAEAKHV